MLTSTLFWFIVAFALFFILVGKKIVGSITAGLDAYREKVKAEVNEAQGFKEKAQSILSETQKKHRQLLLEADDILAQAKEEASIIKKKAETEAQNMLVKIEKSMTDKVTQLENKTKTELKEMTMEIALKAAQQVFEKKLTKRDHKKMIDESISLLANKMN